MKTIVINDVAEVFENQAQGSDTYKLLELFKDLATRKPHPDGKDELRKKIVHAEIVKRLDVLDAQRKPLIEALAEAPL